MDNQSTLIFPCQDCSKSFAKRRDYNYQEKKSVFKCVVPKCKFRGTTRKDYLWKHMKDFHRYLDSKGSDLGPRIYYNQALSAVSDEMLSQASHNARGLELLEATYQGDEVQVEDLIRNGIDLSTKDAQGRAALCIAVERGYTYLVQTLSQLGLPHQTVEYQNQRQLDRNGRVISLLYVVAEKGYVDIVDILLKNGADINWRLSSSRFREGGYRHPGTALAAAAIAGQRSTAQALLDHGADFCSREDSYLFVDGHIDVVRLLIRHQSNIHQKYYCWHNIT